MTRDWKLDDIKRSLGITLSIDYDRDNEMVDIWRLCADGDWEHLHSIYMPGYTASEVWGEIYYTWIEQCEVPF